MVAAAQVPSSSPQRPFNNLDCYIPHSYSRAGDFSVESILGDARSYVDELGRQCLILAGISNLAVYN